jgi:hypothetical protein
MTLMAVTVVSFAFKVVKPMVLQVETKVVLWKSLVVLSPETVMAEQLRSYQVHLPIARQGTWTSARRVRSKVRLVW